MQLSWILRCETDLNVVTPLGIENRVFRLDLEWEVHLITTYSAMPLLFREKILFCPDQDPIGSRDRSCIRRLNSSTWRRLRICARQFNVTELTYRLYIMESLTIGNSIMLQILLPTTQCWCLYDSTELKAYTLFLGMHILWLEQLLIGDGRFEKLGKPVHSPNPLSLDPFLSPPLHSFPSPVSSILLPIFPSSVSSCFPSLFRPFPFLSGVGWAERGKTYWGKMWT